MRSFRLAVAGASPCDACHANCCKQNGHDYAVLLEGEDEHRRFRAFAAEVVVLQGDAALPVIERALPYRDGRCIFLGSDDRCTIYADRPRNCRRFECTRFYRSAPAGAHGDFLLRNPDVLALLERM